MQTACCPFCLEPLTPEELHRRAVYCNYIEWYDSRPSEFKHSPTRPLTAEDGNWQVPWSELIADPYFTAAEEDRVRFVSLVGSTKTGKTVWQLSLGAHMQCPEPYCNYLDETMTGFIPTVGNTKEDRLREAIQQFPLGRLPRRTDLRPLDALTLPVDISDCSGELVDATATTAHDDEIVESTNRGLLFVTKDVAGEAYDKANGVGGNPIALMQRKDLQHLFLSDWLMLVLSGNDDAELRKSAGKMERFLNAYKAYTRSQIRRIIEQDAGEMQSPRRWQRWGRGMGRRVSSFWNRDWQRRPGVIVVLTQVDGRSEIRGDTLWKAVATPPNTFRNGHVDLPEYVDQMHIVQKCVKELLAKNTPGLLKKLRRVFDKKRIRYVAMSPLGHSPCTIKESEDREEYEAQCVAEPTMLRVMDPILWMLDAEDCLSAG